MPFSNGIFYENQYGGLCRMHSINAFFGYRKITPEMFKEFIHKYDMYIKKRFNVKTSSSDFDLVNSDQTNLVLWILKHYRIHMRYYSLNSLYDKSVDDEIKKSEFIFMYNERHIWGVRLHNRKHYTVDSISGVRLYNINSISNTKNIGIMLPVSLKKEWYIMTRKINNILDREKIKSKKDLENYLKTLHKNKLILGDIEIPLGVSISILETKMPIPSPPEFKRISDLINKYNTFISIFTNGNYNNLELILENLPDILFNLMSLT